MNSEGHEVSENVVSEFEEIDGDFSAATAAVEVGTGVEVDSEVMLLAEATDPELVLPVWEATGNVEVDQALEVIQLLDSEDVHQHPEVLGEVHSQLHGLMSQLDR